MPLFFSPAKVNFFFRVLGRRLDGYHEIASLYCALSLGDLLHIYLSQEDRFFFKRSNDSFSWYSELDYSGKGVVPFCNGGFSSCYHYSKKKIPLRSGLGGGSSNAATTLWAMNQLFGKPLSLTYLTSLSAKLGSDVPFFFSKGFAYCTGRGERVANIFSDKKVPCFWIAIPKKALFKYEKGV